MAAREMKQERKNESGGRGRRRFPLFPTPSPLFHFFALVSFLARPKPPFFARSLTRSLTLVPRCLLLNRTETLATQAKSQFKRGLLAPPGAPLFMSRNARRDILVPFGQHWGPKDRNSENENVLDIDWTSR